MNLYEVLIDPGAGMNLIRIRIRADYIFDAERLAKMQFPTCRVIMGSHITEENN